MVGFDSYFSKPLNIATDDSFFGSQFVGIIARLCRWLCLRLATCRNQRTSRKMIVTWTCCTSKSAYFSWHDSFLQLLAKISAYLSRWLCIRLATCRNQHTSRNTIVALTHSTSKSAHFYWEARGFDGRHVGVRKLNENNVRLLQNKVSRAYTALKTND